MKVLSQHLRMLITESNYKINLRRLSEKQAYSRKGTTYIIRLARNLDISVVGLMESGRAAPICAYCMLLSVVE